MDLHNTSNPVVYVSFVLPLTNLFQEIYGRVTRLVIFLSIGQLFEASWGYFTKLIGLLLEAPWATFGGSLQFFENMK